MKARQRPLGWRDRRRNEAKKWVRVQLRLDFEHSVGVNLLYGGFVIGLRHDSVHKERLDHRPILCRQRLLHLAWTRVGDHDGVRRVGRTKSRGQKLRPKHVDVRLHRHLHHFLMKMADGGGGVTTRRHSKSGVLNDLESFDGSLGGVGSPNRSGVVKRGFNQRLEGDGDDFLRRAPRGTRKRLQKSDLRPGLGGHFPTMGAEGEMRIKFDAQKSRRSIETQHVTPESDRRMEIALVSIWGK